MPSFTSGDTTRHTPIGVSGVVCDVLEVQELGSSVHTYVAGNSDRKAFLATENYQGG
ncbi:hypothetical protein N9N45_07345 [Planktomarina temperata]|nr:hypothetical protein [Planktomarina temperata]MDB0073998.1 hypothetical protein [Planktomarina temperata]